MLLLALSDAHIPEREIVCGNYATFHLYNAFRSNY
ncbi:vacuolar protein sorting-associated protein 29 [Kluyveromyces marxianus]|uniref:Vacuolar protein sorting-associated protein 29 n=1 Tax=Kluyveromyces marxianus TaxID=4911 RepID=A0ABX6EQZ5_KLUMA|nr:vacuolar protein sorting-associated protein 29 [Kluyveromyces marxianus]